MRVELVAICDIKKFSITENNTERIEEVDKNIENFLIKENEKDEDLLIGAKKNAYSNSQIFVADKALKIS